MIRGWAKQLRTRSGVKKRTIAKKEVQKLRNFVFRWSQPGEDAAADGL